MKIGDVFTLTRESYGSAGYTTGLVKLEKLALVDVTCEASATGLMGAPSTLHFTFQAFEAGIARIQFASYRPWLLPNANLERELVFQVDEKAKEAGPLTAGVLQVGGWTPLREVDADSKGAFQKAFAEFSGAAYTPFLVATQVVAGTNYIFVTNGKGVYPGAVEYPALVSIFQGLDGKAQVSHIKELGHPGGLGAYSPFRAVTEADSAVIKAATEHWLGGGFEMSYVSTQVVAGVNYRFAGTETLTDGNGTKVPVLVTVYAPLDGTPQITAVQNVYALV
jgi:hypothetical protein